MNMFSRKRKPRPWDPPNLSEEAIKSTKATNRWENIKFIAVAIFGLIGAILVYGFFTSPPSTKSVCYTWSKATDPYIQYDENGIDGAQWLADNIKTEKDLENIDPDVLSAMRLYDTGAFLEEFDSSDRMGLRQFVIDACEKAAPGSTKH
jgi:hypothetical protein